MIGDSIPFNFHDVYAFADLFLAKRASKLVAVTSYFDVTNNLSKVEIHTIAFPPVGNSGSAPLAGVSAGSPWGPRIRVAPFLLFSLLPGGLVGRRFKQTRTAAHARNRKTTRRTSSPQCHPRMLSSVLKKKY